jgi:hypothetical protein
VIFQRDVLLAIHRQMTVRPHDCPNADYSPLKARATADILELLAIEVDAMAPSALDELARAANYGPRSAVPLSDAGLRFLSCLGYEDPPLTENAKILDTLTEIEWGEQRKALG